MRGLMEKDLMLTLARKRTLLIFFIMALVMRISMDGSFLVGYLTMLAAIISVGTVSYDEFDNGFVFLMTLPFERKTYVREKYLFCLLMTAAAWCVGAVLYFIGNVIQHAPADPIREIPMLLSVIPVLYLSIAVMIPLQLKYGSEKARLALFILFGLIAILLFGANTLFSSRDNPFSQVTEMLDKLPSAVILLILTAVCGLLSCISFLWSTKIMEKKEF